jgi:transposase
VEHEEAVWTFARVRGVEVTNNRAERAIRPAVLWRSSSQGTRTDQGEQFVGGMLTVTETLKLQGRDILSWLTEAICALRLGSTPPSLLPQTT